MQEPIIVSCKWELITLSIIMLQLLFIGLFATFWLKKGRKVFLPIVFKILKWGSKVVTVCVSTQTENENIDEIATCDKKVESLGQSKTFISKVQSEPNLKYRSTHSFPGVTSANFSKLKVGTTNATNFSKHDKIIPKGRKDDALRTFSSVKEGSLLENLQINGKGTSKQTTNYTPKICKTSNCKYQCTNAMQNAKKIDVDPIVANRITNKNMTNGSPSRTTLSSNVNNDKQSSMRTKITQNITRKTITSKSQFLTNVSNETGENFMYDGQKSNNVTKLFEAPKNNNREHVNVTTFSRYERKADDTALLYFAKNNHSSYTGFDTSVNTGSSIKDAVAPIHDVEEKNRETEINRNSLNPIVDGKNIVISALSIESNTFKNGNPANCTKVAHKCEMVDNNTEIDLINSYVSTEQKKATKIPVNIARFRILAKHKAFDFMSFGDN